MSSKSKGSDFERLVVSMIRSELDLTRDEVFRTPMSGAHFAIGTAVDIQLQGRASKRFPYAVECKHVRTWNPGVMLLAPLRRQEESWLAQAVRGASVSGLAPLLVMRGNRTDIWAATHDDPRLEICSPRAYFVFGSRLWVMALFSEFLRAVKSYSNVGGYTP